MEPLGVPRSLRDQALETLRQAIVSGEIRAGELHSATVVAKRLGVSVSPVREAMLTLVHEGILEPVRNRGFRVNEVAEDDLREIIELRLWLEIPAMVELAGRPEELVDELPGLYELSAEIDQLAADGDPVGFLVRDREFHLRLLALHGNGRLVDSVAVLRDQTRLYGIPHLARAGRLVETAAEHGQMLEAIEAGDPTRVAEIMRLHLSHVTGEWAGDEPPAATLVDPALRA